MTLCIACIHAHTSRVLVLRLVIETYELSENESIAIPILLGGREYYRSRHLVPLETTDGCISCIFRVDTESAPFLKHGTAVRILESLPCECTLRRLLAITLDTYVAFPVSRQFRILRSISVLAISTLQGTRGYSRPPSSK